MKKTSRQVQRDRERTQLWRAQCNEKQQTGREHCRETPADKPTPPGDVPAPVVGVKTRSMTKVDAVKVDTPENPRTTSTPEIAMYPPPPPVQSLTIDKMTCDMSMLYQDPETPNITTASVRSDKTDDVDDLHESVDESEENDTPPDSPPLWCNRIMEKTSQDICGENIPIY